MLGAESPSEAVRGTNAAKADMNQRLPKVSKLGIDQNVPISLLSSVQFLLVQRTRVVSVYIFSPAVMSFPFM